MSSTAYQFTIFDKPVDNEQILSRFFTSLFDIKKISFIRDDSSKTKIKEIVVILDSSNNEDVLKEQVLHINDTKFNVKAIGVEEGEKIILKHKTKMYVGNLPPSCDNVRLWNYFAKYGSLDYTYIIKPGTKSSKGFGYIIYEQRESLEKALKSKNYIDGHRLVCKLFLNKGQLGKSSKGKSKKDKVQTEVDLPEALPKEDLSCEEDVVDLPTEVKEPEADSDPEEETSKRQVPDLQKCQENDDSQRETSGRESADSKGSHQGQTTQKDQKKKKSHGESTAQQSDEEEELARDERPHFDQQFARRLFGGGWSSDSLQAPEASHCFEEYHHVQPQAHRRISHFKTSEYSEGTQTPQQTCKSRRQVGGVLSSSSANQFYGNTSYPNLQQYQQHFHQSTEGYGFSQHPQYYDYGNERNQFHSKESEHQFLHTKGSTRHCQQAEVYADYEHAYFPSHQGWNHAGNNQSMSQVYYGSETYSYPQAVSRFSHSKKRADGSSNNYNIMKRW